jgi:outer membrane protein Pom
MICSYQKTVFMTVIVFFTTALFYGVAGSESQKSGSTSSLGSQTTRQEKKKRFNFSRNDFKSTFAGTFGYRSDDLRWNIAGDTEGNNPNILSELEWEDLGIFQIKGSNVTVFRGVYLKGSLAYGWIFSGDVQDSDYLGDNRALEFSRSNNNADDGNTMDASMGIGYQFLFRSGFIGISPMIGYSHHEQNLIMTDGNQTVASIPTPPLGGFEGLNMMQMVPVSLSPGNSTFSSTGIEP